jgi:hypothetical protein
VVSARLVIGVKVPASHGLAEELMVKVFEREEMRLLEPETVPLRRPW